MTEFIRFLKEYSVRNNIKIYLVGGYVRDILLGKISKDIDIVVEKDLNNIIDEINSKYKVKSLNINEKFTDYRVTLNNTIYDLCKMNGSSIIDDLKKRDFTINSIAVDILKIDSIDKINKEILIDPCDGFNDIKLEIIRSNYENLFNDSPIRMLRAIRLISELKFELDKNTSDLITKNSELIKELPGCLLRDELFRLLKLEKTYNYFVYMDKLEILDKIFPEIVPMKDVGQCKYHVVDSYTHSIYTLKLTEEIIYADGFFETHLRNEYEKHCAQIIFGDRSRIELIKLGAFFHDVGKPSAKWVDETGRVRFRGHEETGAEIIDDIGKRLELSDKERDILIRIVNKHMIPLVSYKSNDVSGKALYDMFDKCKSETLDILLVALADIVSTRKLLFPDEEMGKFKVHIEYIANNYITRYKELEDISNIINKEEIINELNINKEKVDEIIEKVRKAIFTSEIPKKKEEIIKYLKNSI